MHGLARVYFEEVAVTGYRTFKDPVTGKKRQRTKKFWATINPFNKNEDGTMKTREQLYAKVTAERDAWLALSVEDLLNEP